MNFENIAVSPFGNTMMQNGHFNRILNCFLISVPLIILALGCSLLSMAGFVASAQVLPGPKPLLLGIAFTSSSLGIVIFQQTQYFLIQEYGVRGCFLFLASLYLNAIPAGLIIGMSNNSNEDIATSGGERKPVKYQFIKSYMFILWMSVQFLAASNLNFMSISVSDYLVELGYEEIYATLLLSLMSGTSIMGTLGNGVISQRFRTHALKFQCVCFILYGLLVMVLSLTGKIEALILITCVCGISKGFIVSSRAIGTLILTSSDDYPQAFGIIISVYGLGNLISGPILGK